MGEKRKTLADLIKKAKRTGKGVKIPDYLKNKIFEEYSKRIGPQGREFYFWN